MGHKSFHFSNKNYSAHKLLLENEILRAELQIAKTSLNRLFEQTNINDQMKFIIIGNFEIKVNNRTYEFSLTTKCKSKWCQNSISNKFVQKWNKLPRALRKVKPEQFFFLNEGRDAKKNANAF